MYWASSIRRHGRRARPSSATGPVPPDRAGPAEFRQWSAELLPEIDQLKTEGFREFIRRRVHDWMFYLSIEDGHVPTPAELAKVTDWMQRVLAEESTSPGVLALLAESGNAKKTRNIAKNRAGSRKP
ncbi:hypothetical protein ABZ554_44870 [Streptomyces sp. NPDC020125]|uniref:hypothetical protein n=1 Tax=Streptomyces sp. NPDC020125 TaxID=3154593 RepID=UPI0033F5E1A8